MIDSAQASTNRWEPTKRGRAQQCMDVCQFVHTLVMETDDHNKRRSSRSRARRPDRHQGKVPGGHQEQPTRRPHGCQVRPVLQVGVHVGLLRARLASSETESSATTPTSSSSRRCTSRCCSGATSSTTRPSMYCRLESSPGSTLSPLIATHSGAQRGVWRDECTGKAILCNAARRGGHHA